MKKHAIHVSDNAYQLLLEQSARLNTTPEELIERLLVSDGAELLMDDIVTPTSQAVTLAAVQRLAGIFADGKIDNLEQALNDPMLALATNDPDFERVPAIAVRLPG